MLFVDISGICSRSMCRWEQEGESTGVRTSKRASRRRTHERIKGGRGREKEE